MGAQELATIAGSLVLWTPQMMASVTLGQLIKLGVEMLKEARE